MSFSLAFDGHFAQATQRKAEIKGKKVNPYESYQEMV